MEKPTLEEVKKHFENAEDCMSSQESEFRMSDYNLDGIYRECGAACIDRKNGDKKTKHLYDFDDEKWGRILTTKQPTYSITADQLMQLENGFTLPKLKEWFPEVFETKLEVGKWYRTKHDAGVNLFCFNGDFDEEKDPKGYGFDSDGKYRDIEYSGWGFYNNNPRLATSEEVFEALKNEAVKRGFVKGNVIENIETEKKCFLELSRNGFLLFNQKTLNFGNQVIFLNGIWAKVYQRL